MTKGILVHEWLSPTGGSENVFEHLASMFPDAERWCLWNESGGRFSETNETILARTPLRGRKALSLPFMPFAWRALPAREADWVLASSHAFAHHARFAGPARDVPKLVYAHTPARYVWEPDADSRGSHVAARAVSAVLRPLDRRRAAEPASIAANSEFVARRVERTWQRDARVIYPPVDTHRFSEPPALSAEDRAMLDVLPDGFVLGASRLVPYKRLDAAIDAGIAVGAPVVIAGSGPDRARLDAYAAASGAHVHFVEAPSAELLAELYRRARVFVFAPVEDFGIMPVEAMAAGTPVLVNAIGGAAESVVHGETGAHVTEWNAAGLVGAMEIADSVNRAACIERAARFSASTFDANVRAWLRSELAASPSSAAEESR